MHYYQFHVGDWILDTNHLTLEEEAVYRRLLDHYYNTESAIPEETQSVIRRLRLRGYEELVGSILDEFFVLEEDGWHNKRADKEIADYNKKAEQARNNGRKGGRPKKEKQQVTEEENPEKTQSVSIANQEESGSKTNHKPLTNNHKPNNTPLTPQSDDSEKDFQRFWDAFGLKKGLKPAEKAFLKAIKKISVDDLVMKAKVYHQWCQKTETQQKYAQGWLNDERWNDDLTIPAQKQRKGNGAMDQPDKLPPGFASWNAYVEKYANSGESWEQASIRLKRQLQQNNR